MGNRITRTVLFAASALLSMSAFGAGAARFGTLRNSDWVVTNAWQAVSNKTHDLIIDLGQEASLPPNWSNVSNAAMSAVQSLSPVTNYVNESISSFSETGTVQSASSSETALWSLTADTLNDGGIQHSYSDITSYMDSKISTNNPAFVSAVLDAPLVGADPSDLSELAEYGSYGTVGAAILALIAGLAALKRRMTAAETAIEANTDNLPYALVMIVTGHLADRAVNIVSVSSATTLTLPAANPGHARDFLVRLEVTESGGAVPTITFAAPTGETIVYETDGDEFPVPDAEGTWLYSFTETAAHTFAVSLKKVNTVAQGGS